MRGGLDETAPRKSKRTKKSKKKNGRQMANLRIVTEGGDFLVLEFEDNRIAAEVYGEHDRHLTEIEQAVGVELSPRGNQLHIAGTKKQCRITQAAMQELCNRSTQNLGITPADVRGSIAMAEGAASPEQKVREKLHGDSAPSGAAIITPRKTLTARTPGQAAYMEALQRHELVFGIGPAGTGKTYVAVAQAVQLMSKGKVDRIILSRPAVEAGERLGFLPGDMRDKVDPYLRPLYDALYDMMEADIVVRRLTEGTIEVAPLAFMRGRTLSNAFIILDEAQNCTPGQMKMFLTRLGENSRMVITGDPSQIDLPLGSLSGLVNAVDTLEGVEGVGLVRFTSHDVVRHPLVTRVVKAYQRREGKLIEDEDRD